MTWIIDGIDLSNYAFNISNRSAGWKMPGKRGENLVIPGRNGALWVPNKPFEQGQLTLSMWAVGATETGDWPAHGDAARQCRDNLDKLTALFSQSHKLLNVVKVLGKAFGALNAVSNPAFEGVATDYAAYSNYITNPAFRKMLTKGLISNLLVNPNFITPQAGPAFVESHRVINPDPAAKFYRNGAAIVTIDDNYVPFPSFELSTSLDSWNAGTNIDKAIVAATTESLGGSSVARFQAAAALAANAVIAQRGLFLVHQGGRPNLRFRVRRAAGTAAGTRTIQIRLVAQDASEVTQTPVGVYKTVTLPAGTTWTDATFGNEIDYGSYVMASPTTRMRVDIRTGEAWSTGDGIIIDQMALRGRIYRSASATSHTVDPASPFYNTPGPYFDGSSGWGGLSWDGTVNNSVSRWKTTPDTRWVAEAATSTSNAFYAFADVPSDTDPNGTVLGFVSYGFVTGGTQGFTQDVTDAAVVGEPYVLRFNARALSGATCKVQLQSKQPADAGWTTRQEITLTGAGTASATGTRMNGVLTPYTVSDAYTPVSDDSLRIRVEVPVRTDGHHVLQFSYLGVSTFPANISGDSVSTVNSQFSWAGTARNSASIYAQRRVNRLTGRHALISTVQPIGASGPELIVESLAKSSNDPLAKVVFEAIALPADHQGFSAVVQAATQQNSDASVLNGGTPPDSPAGQLVLEFLDAGSSVIQTFTSAATPLQLAASTTSAQFTPIALQVPKASVPVEATQVRMSVQMVSPFIRANFLWVWRPLLMPTAMTTTTLGVPSFFSGATSAASPFTYGWAGTANDSISQARVSVPASWYVTEGQQFVNTVVSAVPERISARSTLQTAGSSPRVGFGIPLSSVLPAGQYTIGCKCRASLESAPGTETTTSSPVMVMVEFWNGNTRVSSHNVGTVSAKTGGSLQTLRGQGTITVPGAFSEVRVIFVSQRIDAAYLVAEMNSAYLTGNDETTVTNPIPRTDFNRVPNAGFERGLDLWRPLDTAPTSISGYDKPVYALGASALASGDVVISTGQQLHVQTLYRRGSADNLNTQVRWCRRTRTNYALDPSFSTTAGKLATGGATVAVSSAWSLAGAGTNTTSLSVTPTAGDNNSGVYPFDKADGTLKRLQLKPGQGYVYSVTARLTAAQTGALNANARRVVVQVKRNGAWSTLATSAQAANAAGETRLQVFFLLPPDTEDCSIQLVNGSAIAADVVWFDGQQLEDVTTTVRTNLLTNPGGETSDGWIGTLGTITRDASVKRSGTYGVRATATAVGTTLAAISNVGCSSSAPIAVTPGQTYSYSFWVFQGAANTRAQAQITPYINGVAQTVLNGAQTAIAVNAWTRVVMTFTAAAGVTSVTPSLNISKSTGTAAIGDAVVIDEAILEAGSALGQFFSGDTTSTGTNRYYWRGAANASQASEYVTFSTVATTYFDGSMAATTNVWYRWVDPTSPLSAGSELIAYTTTAGNVGNGEPGGVGNGQGAFNQVYQLLTAPANTDFAVLVYSGQGVRVYWTYAGVSFTNHEEFGTYDVYPYWYFDGSTTDYFGNKVVWSGTVDDSVSVVRPDFPLDWQYTLSPVGANLHILPQSAKASENPPTAMSKVGSIPRIPRFSTNTYRSVGIPLSGNDLLSGEISVGVSDGAQAVVGLFGASSSSASGVELTSQTFTAGGKLTWLDLSVSAYDYVYIQVRYTEGKYAPGYRVRLDNFLLMPTNDELGGDYPGYFDGQTSGGGWTGTPHASTSQYFGGGRRAYCEVREAIDMTSMAGGTRAEFVVDMDLPGALWEDLILSTFEVTLVGAAGGFNQTLDLAQLAGTTAMIDDAIISVKPSGGTLTDIKLTDVATESSITITGDVTNGQEVIIDNDQFTVKQGVTSWISRVFRSGNNANLLSLTPMSSVLPPRLRIEATGANVGLTLKVIARRRYGIA